MGKTQLLRWTCQLAQHWADPCFVSSDVIEPNPSRNCRLIALDDLNLIEQSRTQQMAWARATEDVLARGGRVVSAITRVPRVRANLMSVLVSGLNVTLEHMSLEDAQSFARAFAGSLGIEADVRKDLLLDGRPSTIAGMVRLTHACGKLPSSVVAELDQTRCWVQVRLEQILKSACDVLNVTKADVLGSQRHRKIVMARALYGYIARQLTRCSYPEIAQVAGRNYHSTIHTAVERAVKHIARGDEEYVRAAALIRRDVLRETSRLGRACA